MASTIKLKNGSGAPLAGDLVQGEPALDLTNKRLYTEDSGGTVIEVGTNPTSITTGTITASGEITANGGIALGDNDKATFGASDDLEIYSSGTSSYITESGSGNLYIRGNNLYLQNADSSESYLVGVNGGNVFMRYAGDTKLATTSTGIDVTGTVVSDGLTVDGTATIQSAFPVLNFTDSDGNPDYQIQGGNGRFSVIDSTASATRLRIDNGGDISFYEDTGTTAKFYWDASAESLGIGTSSPSQLLELSAGAPRLRLTDKNSVASLANTYIEFHGSDDRQAVIYTSSGDLIAQTDSAGGGDFVVNTSGNNERMRIDSSGNVGIGITSPSYLVDAQSSGDTAIRIRSTGTGASDDSLLRLQIGGTTASNIIAFGDSDTSFAGEIRYTHSNNNMSFDTNGSERMRIDSSGNVGIGTSSPAAKLEIGGAGEGIILASPDGTRYEITVANGGTLTVTAV